LLHQHREPYLFDLQPKLLAVGDRPFVVSRSPATFDGLDHGLAPSRFSLVSCSPAKEVSSPSSSSEERTATGTSRTSHRWDRSSQAVAGLCQRSIGKVLRIEGGCGEAELGRDLVVGGEGAKVGGLDPDPERVAAGEVAYQRTSGVVLVIIVLPPLPLLAYNRSVTNSGFSETLCAKRIRYIRHLCYTPMVRLSYTGPAVLRSRLRTGRHLTAVLGGSGCELLYSTPFIRRSITWQPIEQLGARRRERNPSGQHLRVLGYIRPRRAAGESRRV
jgi:hypothetical protein